ncbi:hypothetical protein BC936DRAFT_144300 [Jimgerdemannia flammicorona]|uniref:AAA-ATPase-like domain-containing protein n=1 Tax=Jimgerdemannia flammicorona TaxID=994334 RepID=A0A433DCR8_9FUNG|nr:hypothetical protein BC936DRAFT_144300 [Jimgerdemannia flammicorona]
MRRGNCSRSIFASIRSSSSSISSKTWELTQEKLRGILANLYKEHGYVRDRLDSFDKQRCNLSTRGRQLSEHLRIYYGRKCIVLISEYDHPLDIAFQHNFYDSACDFFRTLFGSLLKVSIPFDDLVNRRPPCRCAKSGYLSDFNNVMVYPMFDSLFADKLGFTEEVVVLVGHHRMDMKGVKEWYDDYRAANNISLYNPWSVNSFIQKRITGSILHSNNPKADFVFESNIQDIAARLLNGDVIEARLKDNLCYDDLFRRADDALWTLLYYAGYLSHEEDLSVNITPESWRIAPTDTVPMKLRIPMPRFQQNGLDGYFHRLLANTVVEDLSFNDVGGSNAGKKSETFYHGYFLGWLAHARFTGCTVKSNREAGLGRYDALIEYQQDQAIEKKVKEALSQIEYKKYRQEVSEDIEQLVEAQKVENEDEEDEKDEDDM